MLQQLGPWGPVIIGGLVHLIAAAATWGALRQQTKINTTNIASLQEGSVKHEGEIGQLFGHTGLTRG